MIAHLPLTIVVVLVAAVVVLWRRTTQHGPVQIYVGEDERSMSPEIVSGARRGSADEPKAAARRGRRRPTPSPSPTDCRGGVRAGPSQQPRPAAQVRRIAALPLHFRLLRALGVECSMQPDHSMADRGNSMEGAGGECESGRSPTASATATQEVTT